MKRTEIIKKIELKEQTKDFNSHVQQPNEKIKSVEPSYNYLRKGVFNKIGTMLTVPIFNFASCIFARLFKLKVVGKKNLKLIKNQGAILTSNHIHDLDCTLIKKVTLGRKLNIIVGEFNNYRGVFGSMLRAGGTLPLSGSPTCMRNLTKAVEVLLNKKHVVLCYPEGALWWCYEKPRPLLPGAFYYAAKFNVPIVPMFFTFKNLKPRKDGTFKKQFILHIGEPILPKPELNNKENIEYLANANFEFNKNVYEKFYNKKLEYSCLE